MSEQTTPGGGQDPPESHGVYGGTQREDGKMQEEPSGAAASVANGNDGADEDEWAEQTETGGDAT
ncbi:MAG TPA: hypothetical protein VHF27_04705 [Acidimicrobiales bacterium]|nr:hypothetical protein [Acidimicrobiales bacterium]